MDRTEEYRANAARALDELKRTIDPLKRAKLRQIANAWTHIAKGQPASMDENFPPPPPGLPTRPH